MAETVERPKPSRVTAREIARRAFRHENSVLIIVLIAVAGIIAFVTGGKTISTVNALNVLQQSAILGVAAVGQAVVVLSGGIDLSVGGVGLFTSIFGALLMTRTIAPPGAGPGGTKVFGANIIGYPLPVSITLPIMVAVAAAWGGINGLLVSRAGIPALIATLGMWNIASGAGFQLGKGFAILNLPDNLIFWGRGSVAGVPVPAIIFIVVVVIAYFTLYHTTFGRSIYAVGGSTVVSWLSGINVKRIQIMSFVISGSLAGLAGVIMTARSMSASMQTLLGLELHTLAAVFIGGISLAGGKGSLIGVVIGTMIIGVINNGMSILAAPFVMKSLVTGAIIIAAVAIDNIRRR